METIILLHGALGTGKDLSALKDHLITAGFEVRLFTFSGHEQNDLSVDFSIDYFVQELKDFISMNNLNGSSVFGYSMGGFVAIKLAASHSAIIKNIITLGTKFNWTKEAIEKEAGNCDPEKILIKAPAFADLLHKTHKDWKALLSSTAKLIRHFSDTPFPDETTLRKINIPVLLGVGDRDKLVTIEETIAVQKLIPNGSVYILPGTQHPLGTAPPDLLSSVITHFIKTTSKSEKPI